MAANTVVIPAAAKVVPKGDVSYLRDADLTALKPDRLLAHLAKFGLREGDKTAGGVPEGEVERVSLLRALLSRHDEHLASIPPKPSHLKTLLISFTVVRNSAGQFLVVKESAKHHHKFWLPAGRVDQGESFEEGAVRETKEEGGIDVRLTGILRVEHSQTTLSARMRVFFLAEPLDEHQKPKDFADQESDEASWMTLEEIRALDPADCRSSELLDWCEYVAGDGFVCPLALWTQEEKVEPPASLFTKPE
jgi:ADP-ribose pyrophosphatase YjhB (NUDIX family)